MERGGKGGDFSMKVPETVENLNNFEVLIQKPLEEERFVFLYACLENSTKKQQNVPNLQNINCVFTFFCLLHALMLVFCIQKFPALKLIQKVQACKQKAIFTEFSHKIPPEKM